MDVGDVTDEADPSHGTGAWRPLSQAERIALAGTALVFLARLATLGWSSFGFYHGWGEANFAIIARNLASDPLVPQRFPGEPFYMIPPLTSYGILLSWQLVGVGEFGARLPSLVAGAASAVGVHLLARRLHGRRVAAVATPLYAVLPWTVLWSGRVKPDPHMLAGLTLGAAGIAWRREHRWALPAGMAALAYAGFAKQPAILFVVAVAAWLLFDDAPRAERRRTALRGAGWLLLAGTPLIAWAVLQLQLRPDAFLEAVVTQSSRPSFQNVTRSVVVGMLGGITPPVLALAGLQLAREDRIRGNLLAWWAGIYLVFAVVKAPVAHEHYTWPAAPPLAVLAAAGLLFAARWTAHRTELSAPVLRRAGLAVLLAGVLAAAVVVLGFAGDLGNRNEARAAEAVDAFADAHPGNRTAVVVHHQNTLPMSFYLPELTYEPGEDDRLAGFPYSPPLDPDDVANRTAGFPHVLVVTWGEEPLPPEADGRPRIEDTTYEFLLQERRIQVVEWR